MAKNNSEETKQPKEEIVTKTVRLTKSVNMAFNIACEREGVDRGAQIAKLIHQWLQERGDI